MGFTTADDYYFTLFDLFLIACIWYNTLDCQITLFELLKDNCTHFTAYFIVLNQAPYRVRKKLDFLKVTVTTETVLFYFQTRENVQYVCPTLEEVC